ncbi:hypothetical protein BKA82DRAFT_474097 [Pisolithus tinctorius]|uniref:Uncharacterized protein n=1 Tax=Pisolithus tinctorius Marx 270 TaxID=870435 RepID=A0A0C3PJJ3_PISTI|nr:hypothetical protein BKA82DRAFT_474097 [Pisolithus tinctorius]KIO14325.1 hypothetical protein M404DRAFT_474097 [Pisolithus tinctorius Marx 270]
MCASATARTSVPYTKVRPLCLAFCAPTLKIIQRSDTGANPNLYGHGQDSDIDDIDKLLARKVEENSSSPPILTLYAECPFNTLLQHAPVTRFGRQIIIL